jgi:hypothetical protein
VLRSGQACAARTGPELLENRLVPVGQVHEGFERDRNITEPFWLFKDCAGCEGSTDKIGREALYSASWRYW